jgi:glycosyltransferase involved in cell wall biosynthesis
MSSKLEVSPKVVIAIPAFNRVKTISRAIESALSQTYSNCTIIIINDGSTDELVRYSKNIVAILGFL